MQDKECLKKCLVCPLIFAVEMFFFFHWPAFQFNSFESTSLGQMIPWLHSSSVVAPLMAL